MGASTSYAYRSSRPGSSPIPFSVDRARLFLQYLGACRRRMPRRCHRSEVYLHARYVVSNFRSVVASSAFAVGMLRKNHGPLRPSRKKICESRQRAHPLMPARARLFFVYRSVPTANADGPCVRHRTVLGETAVLDAVGPAHAVGVRRRRVRSQLKKTGPALSAAVRARRGAGRARAASRYPDGGRC